jgi:hypothetical protein
MRDNMAELYRPAAYMIVYFVRLDSRADNKAQYHLEQTLSFLKTQKNAVYNPKEFFPRGNTRIKAYFLYIAFYNVDKLFDAKMKYIAFIFKILIQGRPPHPRMIRYFLKRRIFKAFFYKNIQRFF